MNVPLARVLRTASVVRRLTTWRRRTSLATVRGELSVRSAFGRVVVAGLARVIRVLKQQVGRRLASGLGGIGRVRSD